MAKKKARAFFICPRWNEVAATPEAALGPAVSGLTPGSTKIMLAIKGGEPVARSNHAATVTTKIDAYDEQARIPKRYPGVQMPAQERQF